MMLLGHFMTYLDICEKRQEFFSDEQASHFNGGKKPSIKALELRLRLTSGKKMLHALEHKAVVLYSPSPDL